MARYISAEGFEKLKAELVHLKTVKRQEIAARLQRAKELGDLSENSEYQEAKEEQGFVEKQIAELEEEIRDTVVITASDHSDTVHIGSTIEVKSHGAKKLFTIVGSAEANPLDGRISNESPLGRAFLGHKPGDKIDVETPGGKVTYHLVSVK